MNNEIRWFWKMKYCNEHSIPPAQTWAWDIADYEFNKHDI